MADTPASGPLLFMFSAKTEDRMRAVAASMVAFLDRQMSAGAPLDLADIAYTLSVGREEMDVRLAVAAQDAKTLRERLVAAIEGEGPLEGVWRGSRRDPKAWAGLFDDDADFEGLIKQWLEREKLSALAKAWVAGLRIDWRRLPSNRGRRRVALPSYPFARDRHWLPDVPGRPAAHPELQRHTTMLDILTPALLPSRAEADQAAATLAGQGPCEQFIRDLLLRAMQRAGIFREPGESCTKAELKRRVGLRPEYSRLFDAILAILSGAGLFRIAGDSVTTALTLPPATSEQALAQDKRRLSETFPHFQPHLELACRCFDRYPEVLSGAVPAIEVIFPDSSMKLVEPLYRGNAVSSYTNEIVARAVREYVAARVTATAGPIRIIEIGAGTAGTTRAVLAALEAFASHVRYVFTDISRAFLPLAEQDLGVRFGNVEFRQLDIERAPATQGFAPGEFDLVIAANVLHATALLPRTLGNVRSLLCPNGWLLLNEATTPLIFTTLTFGLLDGWWKYEDGDNRLALSPLCDAGGWRRLLVGSGFVRVLTLEPDGTPVLPQQVLVAEADGSVPAGTARDLSIADANTKTARGRAPVAVPPEPPRHLDAAARNRVRDIVAKETAACVGLAIGQDEAETSFAELGVDSILGVELVKRINRRFSIDMPATDLFDAPSVAALSDHIARTYRLPEPADRAPDGVLEPVATPVAAAPLTLEIKSPVAAGARRTAPSTRADIAVVGMAGRFPGAADVDAFYENLAAGRCSVTTVPADRWDVDAVFDPTPQVPGRTYCRSGGFLSDVDQFDPLFFNMSVRDAELCDPQQRVFLEECWNALENAGYANADTLKQSCGVFVGAAKGDYQLRLFREGITEAASFWGNEASTLASRISYFLNLKGPSIAVNTACSSSLVALHLACQSLRGGECEMALAGGVYVGVTPNLHVMASSAGMLSPDGVCRAFDAGANGFVPGEAAGVVVLKRLEAAITDGDHIYGVIAASGINQDGRTNGITAPSAQSQTALETAVLRQAQINPETIGYVEAHGTGTKLGDPIEFKALVDTFRQHTQRTQFCALGSVKTNIGHAVTAAGISGLIKVLLSLRARQIPPSLHFTQPNEHLELAGSPFYVNARLHAWERPGDAPCRAAVSSFGFSGTNAHAIIEEAPEVSDGVPTEPPLYFVPFSARTAQELRAVTARFATWLAGGTAGAGLADIAYTLLVGRTHFKTRAAFVVRGTAELLRALANFSRSPGIAEPVVANASAGATEAVRAWREALAAPANEADLAPQLAALAGWYSSGGKFATDDLANLPERRRVPLPTYPFTRRRCWLQESEARKNIWPGLQAWPLPLRPAERDSVADAVSTDIAVVAPEVTRTEARKVALPEQEGLFAAVQARVIEVIARVLGHDPADLDPAEPLECFGVDSLGALRIGQHLQQDFGELAPESMTDCRTIEALSRYLLRHNSDGASALATAPPPPAKANGRGNGSLESLCERQEIAPIDSATLLTLPVAVLGSGLTRDQVRALFGFEATQVLETASGRIGLFFLPVFDDEVYHDERAMVASVLRAMAVTRRCGARTVSLTGLIPSATDYGRLVAAAATAELPAVTTGHAVTASAVVLTIERICREAGRDPRGERVGFIGVGSIGSAVLRLMVSKLPHPASILLCDVFGARGRLEQLAEMLRTELNYQGEIRIAASRERVAEEIYQSTLIVGATNAPNLLDAEQLQPGTLIVDDSAPHCFSKDAAIARFESRGDILFSEGGLLRLTEPVAQTYHLTDDMRRAVPAEYVEALNWIGRGDPHEIMGCMFSSLLSTRHKEAMPTVGLVAGAAAERHYDLLKRMGVTSAALHCEGFRFPPEALAAFRRQFGRPALRAV